RQQEPQIGGHGLLQGQQAQHAVVDLNLDLVDCVFFNQNGLGEMLFRIQHSVDGLMDGSLGEASHPEQSLFQFLKVAFKMSFHVSSYRSVAVPNPAKLPALTEAARNVGLSSR